MTASQKLCGFTLIELLITLAILGVLATLAVPYAQTAVQRRQEQELRTALRDIRQAIDAYKRASDEGRIAKTTGASGYPPALEVLAEGVIDQSAPTRRKMVFLRRVPSDPFMPSATGDASWGKRSYASDAAAPEEGDDVFDVYSRSARAGLNGVPYHQW